MQISWPPPGIGWIIALGVILLVILLIILGHVTLEALAWCVVALGVARLL